MKYKAIALIIFLALSVKSYTEEEHDHYHKHYDNEIAVANNLIYLPGEKEYSYGIHLHYLRYIEHSHWSFGLGFERVFDDHGHNVISLIANYELLEHWHLLAAPGVSFRDEAESDLGLVIHIETLYEFVFGNFHIGPAAGVAFDIEDYHLGIGLHIGYGF